MPEQVPAFNGISDICKFNFLSDAEKVVSFGVMLSWGFPSTVCLNKSEIRKYKPENL